MGNTFSYLYILLVIISLYFYLIFFLILVFFIREVFFIWLMILNYLQICFCFQIDSFAFSLYFNLLLSFHSLFSLFNDQIIIKMNLHLFFSFVKINIRQIFHSHSLFILLQIFTSHFIKSLIVLSLLCSIHILTHLFQMMILEMLTLLL